MKNPPILIAVLGFFGLMTSFLYIFTGFRLIGFDWFGAFKDAPATTGLWFWGVMWVIVGAAFAAASLALWTLQAWGWLFAVLVAVFGLISAFFVMFDAGIGQALGAAHLPAIILWYLYTDDVREVFGIKRDGSA
jgi:hypothetical protein